MGVLSVLDTETGQVAISIILGLGLAMLFQKVCQDEKCTVYLSPPENKIADRIFTQNGKCYKFVKVAAPCLKANR
jgi:hypothetical protein